MGSGARDTSLAIAYEAGVRREKRASTVMAAEAARGDREMRNTTGKTYVAVGGVFLEGNSAWIRPGTLVHLTVQDGKLREQLMVMYDHP